MRVALVFDQKITIKEILDLDNQKTPLWNFYALELHALGDGRLRGTVRHYDRATSVTTKSDVVVEELVYRPIELKSLSRVRTWEAEL